MNRQSKSLLAASVTASLCGVSGAAEAALYTATLTQVLTYSNNGTSGTAGNITSSTATFNYDDVTNLLTQTGGLFNLRLTTAPTTTLYRTSITGLVIGNSAAASAATYACTEGNFGTGVGASICGNYNFGANFTNQSTTTWGPGTSVSRTLGGDDNSSGAQQSLAGNNNFATLSFNGSTLVLSNATCTGICTTTAGGFNSGQRWTLTTVAAATPGATDDSANAESGVATDINILANDVGYAGTITVTIETAPNNGGNAVVVGSPGAAGGIKITYTSAPGFAGTETFTYRATDGTVNDTGVVTVTVVDTVPNAFSFATQTNVPLSTVVTSANATISGISQAVPVSVAGGTYSVGCTSTYISTASTISNGQDVCVRHTSSASPATDTVTTLTAGGVSGTFTSTTELPDTTPNAYSFPAQTDVALSTAISSASATISGINSAAPISVAGGQYAVDGGAFTSTAGTITNGQSVVVRVTSSATPNTAATATLTIGGVDAAFTVTTVAVQPDTTPDQFTFTDQQNVPRDTLIESAPVTITGINAAAPILVSGAAGSEYSINGGPWTSVQGTVINGQTVAVRHTSASGGSAAVSTVLSVGPSGATTRISDAFSSSTAGSSGTSSVDGLILGVLGLLGLAARRRNRH